MCLGIKPTASAYRDSTLTKQTTRPGQCFIRSYSLLSAQIHVRFRESPADGHSCIFQSGSPGTSSAPLTSELLQHCRPYSLSLTWHPHACFVTTNWYFVILCGTHQGEEFLSHRVTLCLTCWVTTIYFPQWLGPLYIHTSNVWGDRSHLRMSSPTLGILLFFFL